MLKVYENSISMIRGLRGVIAVLERRDPDLARQLKRASSSVALNIAEGSFARGRSKLALYQVALASSKEVIACLDVANALGYIEDERSVRADLGAIGGTLYKLAIG